MPEETSVSRRTVLRYAAGGLARALDAGWRVGAVGSTDNHAADLYRPDRPKTVLVVPGDEPWSRATVRRTLAARRFYATYNESLQLRVRAGDREMGETVTARPGATVEVRVDAFDPEADDAIEGSSSTRTAPQRSPERRSTNPTAPPR